MSNKLRVRIVHDQSPEDPREWDGVCDIVHQGRWDRTVGQQIADLIVRTNGWKAGEEMAQASGGSMESLLDREEMLADSEGYREMWLEAVKDELITKVFHTPHETYLAHTTPTHCWRVGSPWDRAEEAMQADIDTFKQWAEGDVYGFVIEEWSAACACEDCEAGEWIMTDSCWGFYGTDWFTNGMSDYVPEELHDQLRTAEVEYNY